VDGEPIGQADLVARLEENLRRPAALRAGRSCAAHDCLTFFEYCHRSRFLHSRPGASTGPCSKSASADRFDSTECVPARSRPHHQYQLDHTEMLATRSRKSRSKTLASSSGPTHGERRRRSRSSTRHRGTLPLGHAPLYQLGPDYTFTHEPAHINHGETTQCVTGDNLARTGAPARRHLRRAHQAANAAVAVAAVECLRDRKLPIGDDAVARGWQASLPARLEILHRRPLIVLDALTTSPPPKPCATRSWASFPCTGRRVLVFAGSRDKDMPVCSHTLTPIVDDVVFTRFGNNPRQRQSERLLDSCPLGDCRRHPPDNPTSPRAGPKTRATERPRLRHGGPCFLRRNSIVAAAR